MKEPLLAIVALLCACAAAPAQEQQSGRKVAIRVRAGGRFEPSRYQRTADGVLEFDYIADLGGAHDGAPRWQPLCGERLGFGLLTLDEPEMVALLFHGPDDLVAMTDAAFHLRTAGFDLGDVALRQRLLQPLPDGDAARHTELLDRMLVIDLLVQRGCREARAELTGLAKSTWPKALQQRARRALAELAGTPAAPIARQRLDAAGLLVPEHFDLCVVVDHGRLPGCRGLFGEIRRDKSESLAGTIETFGRATTPAMRNGCQRTVDAAGELPFALAHRYGNVRIDHSVLFVRTDPERPRPLDFSWQAAGAFDAERWQRAKLPPRLEKAWTDGVLDVTATRARGSLRMKPGEPRPERAAELLAETAGAVRIVVPADSRLWSLLADAPDAPDAELRVRLGAQRTVELRLTAADTVGAERWSSYLRERRPRAVQQLRALPNELVREAATFTSFVGALAAASIEQRARTIVVEVPLPKLAAGPLLKTLCDLLGR